jgi:serine/threonine protein kinase
MFSNLIKLPQIPVKNHEGLQNLLCLTQKLVERGNCPGLEVEAAGIIQKLYGYECFNIKLDIDNELALIKAVKGELWDKEVFKEKCLDKTHKLLPSKSLSKLPVLSGKSVTNIVYKVDEVRAVKRVYNRYRDIPEIILVELACLTLLKSDRIVRLLTFRIKRKYIDFYLELGSGDFSSIYLNLSSNQITHYFSQIAEAVKVCHSHDIIHCDIKPQNFILFGNDLKLCDFGLSSHTNSKDKCLPICTRWYRPPEIINRDTNYTTTVDWWGVGIILVKMITKQRLFQLPSERQQLCNYHEVLTEEFFDLLGVEWKYIANNLLDFNKNTRQCV